MKKTLLSLGLATVMLASAAGAYAQSMYGITASNEIFSMADVNSPSTINGPYTLSGVASGQTLVALDARNRDGVLYALGYNQTSGNAQLYTITGSGSSYTANVVSSTAVNLNLGSSSNNSIGFNFVSTVENQIRVTGTNGSSYVLNADDGSVISTGSSNMGFATGDVHTTLSLAATAFTNSYYGADATSQYGYDLSNNVLVQFDAANYYNNTNNYPTTVHSVGLTSGLVVNTTTSLVGMDNWFDSGTHQNSLWLAATAALGTGAHLYTFNNTTGAVTDKGAIGSGTLNVRGIAFQGTRDASQANSSLQGSLMAALTLNLRNLILFDSEKPSYIRNMMSLTGMTSGQVLLSVAYGYNDQLYALGYNPTNQNYQLYSVNTVNGQLTAVNGTATSLDLGSTGDFTANGNWANVGFNFIGNATNRIRLIGKRGATNVQLDATTGLIVSTDSSITYAAGDVNATSYVNMGSIAYTNGSANSTASSMLGVDFNTGALVTLNGAANGNSGLVTSVVANLNLFLNIFGNTTNTFRNGYLDVVFDANSNINTGFIATNYYGDSSDVNNYGSLSVISNISATGTITGASHKGNIGQGTPVKTMAARKSLPTAVSNVVKNNIKMTVYPNPTTNSTTILLSEAAKNNVYVSVMDMGGRTVSTNEYGAGSTQLNVNMSRIPAGIYNVRVQDGTAVQNVKVVKQ